MEYIVTCAVSSMTYGVWKARLIFTVCNQVHWSQMLMISIMRWCKQSSHVSCLKT